MPALPSRCAFRSTSGRRAGQTRVNGDAKPSTIRIAVADDHPVVRDGLVAMLETQPTSRSSVRAEPGAERSAIIASARPGRAAARPRDARVSTEWRCCDALDADGARACASIVFTVFDTDERIIAAVEAGAAGYLLKGAPRADVFAAVRVVAGRRLAARAAGDVGGAASRSRRVAAGNRAEPNAARADRCWSISRAAWATSRSPRSSASPSERSSFT